MKNNSTNEVVNLWQNYIRKPAFKKRLVAENFRQQPPPEFEDIDIFISKMAGQSFTSAKPDLKAVMTPAAFTKLCDAYRAYCYKLRHGRKNVSLSAETLARLKPIASRLGLQEPGQGIDGGLDNLLYYLTSPDEQASVQQHLTALAQDQKQPQILPELTDETWLYLFRLRLPPPEQRMLQQVLEKAFTQGWQARAQMKTSEKLAQARGRAEIIRAFLGEETD
ncbi:hypothetical protein [Thalassomonas actiniarum]|uniref:Uncharacterized protein n=1 Tax=Thalassomonas actiniarum TaxID=485447 RepID=A0AAE9YY56_9GAMM|nr:hypothetical protein [Thalassomonas actiniarum]WDE02707.1 hypothetical protein SG35_030370 [Thalassomonas actiniarum]